MVDTSGGGVSLHCAVWVPVWGGSIAAGLTTMLGLFQHADPTIFLIIPFSLFHFPYYIWGTESTVDQTDVRLLGEHGVPLTTQKHPYRAVQHCSGSGFQQYFRALHSRTP